ncbi:hypothetical protein A2368_01490, partial [Candidatus Collierbacteria bacterium RIFOXYB1_FULL_49_13]
IKEAIGSSLIPQINFQGDKYYIIGDEAQRIEELEVTAEAMTPEISYSLSTGTVDYHEYRAKKFLGRRQAMEEDAILRSDQNGAIFLKKNYTVYLEKKIADFAATTSNYDSGYYGAVGNSDKFSNEASDPQAFIFGLKDKAVDCPEFNTMVLSVAGYRFLRTHPKIVKKLAVTKMGIVKLADLQELLEIEKIVVGRMRYISSAEGATTKVKTNIWADNMILAYVNPNPSDWDITWSLGYQKEYFIDQYESDDPKGTYTRLNVYGTPGKKVCGSAAYLATGVI